MQVKYKNILDMQMFLLTAIWTYASVDNHISWSSFIIRYSVIVDWVDAKIENLSVVFFHVYIQKDVRDIEVMLILYHCTRMSSVAQRTAPQSTPVTR